jgi:fructose-1,6-bisphosphatase
MEITPADLHQRVPLVIGSKTDVEFATRAMSAEAGAAGA